MGRPVHPHRGLGPAVPRDVRDRHCGVPRPPAPPELDPHRKFRCRATGLDRHRGRSHHGRGCGVLHHDPGADTGIAAVRAPHDAELRPRHRQPGHAGSLRRDLRGLGARPRVDRQCQPALRAVPLHLGRRSLVDARPRGADLFHPPHCEVDPTARGDRRDRRRPDAFDRRRIPRHGGSRGRTELATARRKVGPRAAPLARRAGCRSALTGEWLHPIRRLFAITHAPSPSPRAPTR